MAHHSHPLQSIHPRLYRFVANHIRASIIRSEWRLTLMTIPLPNELVEAILDNLYSEKSTLLNCALVGRAWAPASQRGIFQRIVLRTPNSHHEDYAAHCEAYMKANERFIELFSENPRLASYVRFLELRTFEKPKSTINQEVLHDSEALLIRMLTNVNSLSLHRVNWLALSPLLRDALTSLFSAPSTTRLNLALFAIPTFTQLTSLLGRMSHLKVLKLSFINCSNWNVPVSTLLESNSEGTAIDYPPPRSIQLDQLLHFHQLNLRSFTAWLQQDSCPFEFQNLRSLQIHRSTLSDFEGTAFMLKYVGNSLRELELMGPYRIQHSSIVHLGYTPNLERVNLVTVQQTDTYTPIPWLQCLFEPLLNHNRKMYPLRRLTIDLTIEHSDALETDQWDHWTALDALLSRPEFAALERVNIILQVVAVMNEVLDGVKELLSEKLLRLDWSGKLRILIPPKEDIHRGNIRAAVTL